MTLSIGWLIFKIIWCVLFAILGIKDIWDKIAIFDLKAAFFNLISVGIILALPFIIDIFIMLFMRDMTSLFQI